MISEQYAYPIFCLIYGLIWLGLFCYRKDLRSKIFFMSLVVGPIGPVSELFYLRDYWHPVLFNGWRIGFEDFVWAFFIGGISSVIYEELFGKKYIKKHSPQHKIWMLVFCLFGVLWMSIGNIILNFNSIYVSISMFLLFALVILIFRHDLIKDAFFSGILIGSIMFVLYLAFLPFFPGLIHRWWELNNLTGVLIFGVPLEELAWGFGWGMVAGPAYEFVYGYRFKKK